MLSALSWVPRGVARPARAGGEEEDEWEEADGDELEGGEADEEGDEAEEQEEADEEGQEDGDAETRDFRARERMEIESAFAKLDMDNYDNEDADNAASLRIFGSGPLTVFRDNKDDPYITAPDAQDDDSEHELAIGDSDDVIIVARTEEDVSALELWVYEAGDENDAESNLYVHHDVLLPAFPLCLTWLDFAGGGADGSRRNLVAVGTMRPEIEVWDMDQVDVAEPLLTLGGVEGGREDDERVEALSRAAAKQASKRGKKAAREQQPALTDGSHEDAVLGLSWNAEYRNVLASASADTTVKIWDLATGRCEQTLRRHRDKVQSVAWNPGMASVLLSGSFDRTVQVGDTRTPEGQVLRWELPADCECCAWNPHRPEHFVASCEDGHVLYVDARAGLKNSAKALWTLAAHEKPASTLCFNGAAAGLLATGSTDKTVKLWDTSDGRPTQLGQQDLQVGAVFSLAFCAAAPSLLAVGGSKGSLLVWDVLTVAGVSRRFGDPLLGQGDGGGGGGSGGPGEGDAMDAAPEKKVKKKKKARE